MDQVDWILLAFGVFGALFAACVWGGVLMSLSEMSPECQQERERLLRETDTQLRRVKRLERRLNRKYG